MTFEDAETIRNTVRRVFSILLGTLLLHHTVETNCLSTVLAKIDQFRIADEITNKDVLTQVCLEGIKFVLSLFLDLLEFSHPAKRNLPCQKVACLFWIK